MGEGMAYGGLPFPDTGCPVPDVGRKMSRVFHVKGIIW